LPVSA